MLKVFTDGGSRGNPGQSAIGVYIVKEDNSYLHGFGKTIGIATNNIAEYKAVIEALSWISKQEELITENSISMYLDSQLVYSQICGLYKVKNPKLRDLLFEIRQKEAAIQLPIGYFHIPRKQNKKADSLVNMALDGKSIK